MLLGSCRQFLHFNRVLGHQLRNAKTLDIDKASITGIGNDPLKLCSLCISTTPSFYVRSRRRINHQKSLLPFREQADDIGSVSKNCPNEKGFDWERTQKLLLNPADFEDTFRLEKPKAPSDARSLSVSVVGVPNAGKSTLVNQLVGKNVCPHSKKVHTTRENTLGILTNGQTQIIFQVNVWVIS